MHDDRRGTATHASGGARFMIAITAVMAAAVVVLTGGCSLSSAPETPAATPASAPALLVAWAERGDLLVWTSEQTTPRRVASGGVIRPYIAPGGGHIAFTRGPLGRPETLWVVDAAGSAEQELVASGRMRSFNGGKPMIGEVAWLDEVVLYFNTAQQYEIGLERQDDLWRANIRTREVSLILPRTDGGDFSISPNGTHIVVVYPGTYGVQDGRIRVIDPLAWSQREALFFVGVSTGAEYKFYPRIFWESDASAFRVAVPDKDLIYDEAAPMTMLWRLGVDGGREVVGQVRASFFGLPAWPESPFSLVYLRRAGAADSNQFEVVTAAGSGQDPTVYVSGEAGALGPAQWIPGSNRFVYTQGEPGRAWVGSPGSPPQRIPNSGEALFNPVFTREGYYVFASAPAEQFALRYAHLDSTGAESLLIAQVENAVPVFDAALRVYP